MSFDDKASHRMAGAKDGGSKGMAGRMDHPLISGISKDLKELEEGGKDRLGFTSPTDHVQIACKASTTKQLGVSSFEHL